MLTLAGASLTLDNIYFLVPKQPSDCSPKCIWCCEERQQAKRRGALQSELRILVHYGRERESVSRRRERQWWHTVEQRAEKYLFSRTRHDLSYIKLNYIFERHERESSCYLTPEKLLALRQPKNTASSHSIHIHAGNVIHDCEKCTPQHSRVFSLLTLSSTSAPSSSSSPSIASSAVDSTSCELLSGASFAPSISLSASVRKKGVRQSDLHSLIFLSFFMCYYKLA